MPPFCFFWRLTLLFRQVTLLADESNKAQESKFHMEIMLILRVIFRRWWLILIPVVVAAIIVLPDFLNRGPALSGGFITTVNYSAAQEFNLPERDGDYQDVWLASELAVNAFTDWVRSSSFKAEVAAYLDDATIDLNLLGIAADNERSIGRITMSFPDAEALEKIALAAVSVLQNESQDYFPQLGGEPARVTLLDTPIVTAAPPAVIDRFAPFVRLGIAFIAGVALAFLVEYLDPRLRRREEVETMGISVVAQIPRHREP